jgi:tetratricopeptide (TPR) repeat protein
MIRSRLLWLSALVLLLAGGAWWAWQQVRAQEVRRFAAAGVPPRPVLDAWPTELGGRIRAQEEAIFAGRDPLGALATLATLYHANGFYAEAQQAYGALQAIQPREPRWPHRSAHIHAMFGELEQAIPLWERVVQLDRRYRPAQVRLGDALLKAGRPADAAAVLQRLLQAEPDHPYAQLGLARVAIAEGNWAEARPQLERLARQTEGLLGADLLASAYERTGEPQRGAALRARQKSHGLYVGPSDPWVDELMEDCYDPYRLALESGTSSIRQEETRTQRLLDRALRLAPDDADLRFQAGSLAEKRGDQARARSELQTAVRLNPALTDAWAALVRVLAAAGDTTGSWRVLSEALSLNPESPVLLLERGRRFKEQGRTDAAIADLRRVTRLRRDEALAFVELASLYFAQDRTEEGITLLEQGLVAEPGHPPALAIITFASILSGDRARADRWLGEVLDQPRVTPPEVQRLQRAYQEKFGQPPPARR